MAITTTENYELEIEDENEKVDNGYINRNFQKIDTELDKITAEKTSKTPANDDVVPVYTGVSQIGVQKPKVFSIGALYNLFKGRFDALYDKSTSVLTGAISTVLQTNLTGDKVTITNSSGKLATSEVSANELYTLKNMNMNVKVAMDEKLPKANPTFTGKMEGPDILIKKDLIELRGLLTALQLHSITSSSTTWGKLYFYNGEWRFEVNDGTTTSIRVTIQKVDGTVRIRYDGGHIVLSTEDVTDNVTSTDTKKPLSANQGRVLKEVVDLKADISYVDTELGKKANTNHRSAGTSYGVGTGSYYGHAKTINLLTKSSYVDGEALSAYQGKVLNDKIEALSTVRSGTSAPANSLGKNGDIYLRV